MSEFESPKFDSVPSVPEVDPDPSNPQWWALVGCKVISMAALFGVVAPMDVHDVSGVWAKGVAAAAIVITSACSLARYFKHHERCHGTDSDSDS